MAGPTIFSEEKPTAIRPRRRRAVGAEYMGQQRTHVRVWAPAAHHLGVALAANRVTLEREQGGYFSGIIPAAPGDRYQFAINDDDRLYPDPASRFQPDGPHGPSEVIDPSTFAWTDADWQGVAPEGQVLYEMHVGTFTREGGWAAATRELEELARIGITMVEIMPVAEFNGRFGWGYDGVDLYAPTRLYGRPDDFRRFVDTAHSVGVAVILDVVYNHLGAVGNYLSAFSKAYFSDKYENEWGDALNFDGPDAAAVREFFSENAAYWIDEFHLDGLRLDATQQIYDASETHIMTEIGRLARQAAGGRRIVLIAENEPQDTRLVRSIDQGGYGLDALWNDDFHHSAMVALTGRAEAYYSDTHGDPQEFISAAKYGYLFQGQPYHWQRKPRGTPAWGLPPATFVSYLQNHDQVANSARGLRGHQLTHPAMWRAMTTMFLLMPSTPLLFQGQEFSASAPFLYFADLEPDLKDIVRKGRMEFLTQFPSVVDYARNHELADPSDSATFTQCVLDFNERRTHREAYALHQDLLALRRQDVAFKRQRSGSVDGAVLSDRAFVLRFFTDDHQDDRLLVVNLGSDLTRPSFAEPLFAPPSADHEWSLRWSSEDPKYGGSGTPPVWGKDYADRAISDVSGAECYQFAGYSAVVLAPTRRTEPATKGVRRRSA
jgi:maltooligosyltrehalose trehalohydrolase